jgi:transposase
MYIRRSTTRNLTTGEFYFTHRLVRTERVDGKVRQITLQNLGRHFEVPQALWPEFCQRLGEIIGSHHTLIPTPLTTRYEQLAQRYASLLLQRSSSCMPDTDATQASAPTLTPTQTKTPDYHEVDCDSLQTTRPRSIGVEHVGLHAMAQLGLIDKLTELGIPQGLRLAAIGNVIARMAHPASERQTYQWLTAHSALGELLDCDFQAMPLMRLYRASDQLVQHRQAIEDHLFSRIQSLFALETTVTLYDLTNTYFEGQGTDNPQAKRGRSKEKRSDCPLVTLGVVLDGSGFIRRSKTFAGNATEAHTLAQMLEQLQAPENAMVIMDAGMSTADNLDWLVKNGYRYLVVSRATQRQFDPNNATAITSASGQAIHIEKQLSDDGKTVRLYCRSGGREKKEEAINQRFAARFEATLTKLAEGLSKPRGQRCADKIHQRIGRAKAQSRGMSQHYRIEWTVNPDNNQMTSLTWSRHLVDGSRASHPGVYCLVTNELTWDAPTLWRTYMTLTDLEAVFRSMKSELGLRPVYHTKQERVDGHLFITVLAYQLVQVLRHQWKQHGIDSSWNTLRETLSIQRRVTTTFQRRDKRTLHVRNTTLAEPELLALYQALGVDTQPGGMRKSII